jgi:cytochrome c oxidase subunit 2
MLRYPGPDGVFGRRVLSKEFVSPDNELGIDWTDPASHDDFFASELYMVKGRPVRFNLGALDVLHSFYLPHFRMKMDCVPGVPTGIGFTPTMTDDETRELLKSNSHWASIDPETNEPRYVKFNYELACAELCGKSHYGMMMPAHVVSQSKFEEWTKTQKPFFEVNKDKIQAWLVARNLSVGASKGSNNHAAFNGEDTSKKALNLDSNMTKVEGATHNIADNKATEGKQ